MKQENDLQKEDDANLEFRVTRFFPRKVSVRREKVENAAHRLWKTGRFGNDALFIWCEAQDRLTDNGYGLPSDHEIAKGALGLWQAGQLDALKNWFDARTLVLANHVWKNPFLRVNIIRHLDDQTMILGVSKINQELGEEVRRFITWRSRFVWRAFGWEEKLGRVQVVINESRGEVALAPRIGFHPTDVFDMFE